jgi:hypothetical protein
LEVVGNPLRWTAGLSSGEHIWCTVL